MDTGWHECLGSASEKGSDTGLKIQTLRTCGITLVWFRCPGKLSRDLLASTSALSVRHGVRGHDSCAQVHWLVTKSCAPETMTTLSSAAEVAG